ncbi:MAG: hypothetical protein QF570_00740 [Myxococcota bacterium]|nr:hypothetical protein [Myxococcota bacterium]
MKTAFDFFHAATRCGISLYRELAVSAYQLVPYAQHQVRSRNAARQLEGERVGLPLMRRSRLA